jgi:ABC-type sulfate/molybdate transport systems ATPase subunit
MTMLRLDAVSRHGPSRRLLDRVSLEVAPGECLVLLGAPGSGRAALLRCIAGVEEVDAGRILLDGEEITRLPPRRRPIGHLVQHDPLFGHPTVFDSVAAALPQPQGVPSLTSAAARVQQVLGMVGLAEDAGSMPAMLPTAKRRRLSLARALATEPRLLLVAEGFGVTDPARRTPRRWLRDIQQRLGLAMILVAQDGVEALELADRIAVLEAGQVVQVATPAVLRQRPASADIARLIGARPPASPATAVPQAVGGGVWLPAEALEVVAPGLGMPARVLGATMLGGTVRLDLELLANGRQVEAEVSSLGIGSALPPGTIIGLRVRGAGLRQGRLLN